tara:strand:+ start:1809 stop:3095 length:1287 start_codon:yes stop_codon:yes gene_type:complete
MDILNETTDHVKKAFNDETGNKFLIIAAVIIFFIIFGVLSWIFNVLSLKDRACENLDKIYTANNKYATTSFSHANGIIKSNGKKTSTEQLNYFDDELACLVKNYYVKTAYNCCCGDGYKNNWVAMCSMDHCIKQGARCLDFEIYSYNGEPIVAASTANNNSIKETYNFLPLTEVLAELNANAHNETFHNCPYDPMFLHFRIMSENKVIYDKMGDYIESHLKGNSDNLLDNVKYNYRNPNLDNLLMYHIGKSGENELHKKFVIMVNTKHPTTLDNSKLANFVNIRSGTKDLKLYRYEEVVAKGEKNPLLIDDSQRSLIMVLPDLDSRKENFDPIIAFGNGCQFIGMKFQTVDNNLLGYFKQFKDTGGFSYVLKPNNLRKDIIEAEPEATDLPINPNRGYDMKVSFDGPGLLNFQGGKDGKLIRGEFLKK